MKDRLKLAGVALTVLVTIAADAEAQLWRPMTLPPLVASLSPDQERILSGIRAGDREAIAEAGRSRDRVYLEALAAALRRQPAKARDWTDVQLALARLGDSEQLQIAWCLSLDERRGLPVHSAI